MSVLVDTSAWVRYLADRPPYGEELDNLLATHMVVGQELIYGELLMGDVGGRFRVLRDYANLRWVAPVPHIDVVELVRSRRLHGRGVGWIEVYLLASALVGGLPVWSADPRFQGMAEELGVAYRP